MGYIYANDQNRYSNTAEIFKKILKLQPSDELAKFNLSQLEKGENPVIEEVRIHFKNRVCIWNPEKPGVVEIEPSI